jgi:hypothetical protein
MRSSQSGQLVAFYGTSGATEETIASLQKKQVTAYHRRPELHKPTPLNRGPKTTAPVAKGPSTQEGLAPSGIGGVQESSDRPPPGIRIDNEIVQDDAKDIVRQTADKKYSCSYGKIPYEQQIKPDLALPAVFVSPVLLRQIGEDVLRVNQARLACDRLVENYDTQVKMLDGRDSLGKYQRGVGALSAFVENARVSQQKEKSGKLIGAEPLDPDEVTAYGLSGPTNVADGLWTSRTNVIEEEDALRRMSRAQVTEVDYGLRFLDVQMAVDLQARALARTLFLLDRSVASADVANIRTDYKSGSWVQQGTVVFFSRPAPFALRSKP